MPDTPLEAPPPTVSRNVETIAAVHAKAEESVGNHQRFIERLTFRLGSPAGLYGTTLLVALWVLSNLGLAYGGLPAPDPPPFVWLQGAVAFAALLVAITVLATQNRQAKHSEQRAELDLQVNLFAEQKVAKLIALLEELRRDLPSVPNRSDPVADSMTRSVDPHSVLHALGQTFEQAEDEEDSRPPSGKHA
jgi:uncharacterized membrane protein